MSNRYTGLIDTKPASGVGPGIGVTGQPTNGTAGHLEALRRATTLLELGGNDRELWHAYADPTPESVLNIARTIHGKALNTPRRRK